MKKILPFLVAGICMLFNNSCKKETATCTATSVTYNAPQIANASCGNNDGSITVSVNGATAPVSYAWSGGLPNSAALTGLAAGTYQVTATGANGCSASASYVVSQVAKQVVEVGSTITSATTWDSCHIYHCANFVGLSATLTIQAGTIVKFDALKGINVNTGMLTVNGSAGHPVIFTSSKDDNYGGDTNGDGSATSPQKGDWEAIKLGTSSGNNLNYCKIFYAGSGTTDLERALNMGDGANNSFTNSVIAHTAGGTNQSYAALDMSYSPHSSVATGNTFFDNGHPVIIGIASDFDDSNVFHNPDNTAQTNVCNGIFVDCVHVTAENSTWSATEVAFVLGGWSGNSWYMPATNILTLGDNVVVKFHTHIPTPGFSLYIPTGVSQLVNYNGTGVAFTAYDDDNMKGDTNGDGPSSATTGSWDGIETTGPVWYSWSNMYFSAH